MEFVTARRRYKLCRGANAVLVPHSTAACACNPFRTNYIVSPSCIGRLLKGRLTRRGRRRWNGLTWTLIWTLLCAHLVPSIVTYNFVHWTDLPDWHYMYVALLVQVWTAGVVRCKGSTDSRLIKSQVWWLALWMEAIQEEGFLIAYVDQRSQQSIHPRSFFWRWVVARQWGRRRRGQARPSRTMQGCKLVQQWVEATIWGRVQTLI